VPSVVLQHHSFTSAAVLSHEADEFSGLKVIIILLLLLRVTRVLVLIVVRTVITILYTCLWLGCLIVTGSCTANEVGAGDRHGQSSGNASACEEWGEPRHADAHMGGKESSPWVAGGEQARLDHSGQQLIHVGIVERA
jgi:hypothetical protein